MSSLYTDAQYKLIAACRRKKWTWEKISHEFNYKFGTNKSPSAMRHAMESPKGSSFLNNLPEGAHAGIGQIVKNLTNVKSKRIILTSAAPSTEFEYYKDKDGYTQTRPKVITHEASLKCVETFLDNNKGAEFFVIPGRAHVSALEGQPSTFDRVIMKYKKNFITDLTVNQNLKIFDAQINPQHIDPLTGLHHITGKEHGYLFDREDTNGVLGDHVKNSRSSLIIPHPKQMMNVMPNGKSTLPRLIHSTGSITSKQYYHNRIGRIAADQHILGGLIIDIVGKLFFIRQFQCNPKTGEFVDFGRRYHADGRVTEESALAVSFGDLHAGAHCPVALASALDMLEFFNPEYAFWHDVFDARSISHHLLKKQTARIKREECFRTLGNEGQKASEILSEIFNRSSSRTQNYIVGSNHNGHLHQYLDETRYKGDDVNFELATNLMSLYNAGVDPLRALIDNGGRHPLTAHPAVGGELQSNFNWLSSSEDFWLEEVQYGEHGHNGIGGAKGNQNSHYIAFGKAVVGHRHKPGIYNGVYVNGTLTPYKQDYNANQPLDWLHSHTVHFRGGHRQLITEIHGQWGQTA